MSAWLEVARRSTCRLTHYGRKSGKRHEVTLWFLWDGAHVYLATAEKRLAGSAASLARRQPDGAFRVRIRD